MTTKMIIRVQQSLLPKPRIEDLEDPHYPYDLWQQQNSKQK